MKDLQVYILSNTKAADNLFLLTFLYPQKVLPGQFFNIRLSAQNDPYLRRPLSVHDYDSKKKRVSILYKVIGKGTKYLSKLPAGTALKVLGPLGNTFDLTSLNNTSSVALIGGGVGNAPLLYLAKELALKEVKMDIFFGFKTKKEVYIPAVLKKLGKVNICTDDGTMGRKGFVTEVFSEKAAKKKYDHVFVCGPELMMKLANAVCKEKNIPVQLSLESIMGCGIGACMCCVTETITGYKKVCSDGPVFKGGEIV